MCSQLQNQIYHRQHTDDQNSLITFNHFHFRSLKTQQRHPQTHKRPMLLMGKSLRHERGDVDEDSHETYFFVPSRPTIHTLMALSKKISRNTYDSRASFQHTTDTIEHSEKSVPIKYGTQVKTTHLKRSAVMARLTHSHFLYCLGVTCNKWFCARPLKTDYR